MFLGKHFGIRLEFVFYCETQVTVWIAEQKSFIGVREIARC